MTTLAFLAQLRRLGVRLWVEGERLRYSAPDDALTPDLRTELAARKAEIIAVIGVPAAPRAAPPIAPAAQSDHAPLSFEQQRLWFLDQLAPNTRAYAMPLAVRLHGRLHLRALAESLATLRRRHAILRTTFALHGGQPVQRSAPPDDGARFPLHLCDLRGLPPQRRDASAFELARQAAQRPFDLTRGPLLRLTLLRLASDQHLLVLILHHIIADAWSLGLLLRELVAFYDVMLAGLPAELPDLPIQYADYAAWQRTELDSAALASQLAYWQAQLAELPTLALPTDRPRPPMQSFRGALWSFDLESVLADGLAALSRQEGATPFMTLLAAFVGLLSRYSGQDDLALGTPIANRGRAELAGLIGLFVNTLVLRFDLAAEPTFRALLARVRAVALGGYAQAELPFEQLVAALAPERDLSRHPLFQVLFVLQNAAGPPVELADLTLEPIEFDGGTAKLDLTLTFIEAADGLRAVLEYSSDLFERATIARMAGHLRALLVGIVADPNRRLADLPLLSAAEQQQLLVEWNDTTVEVRSQESGVRITHPIRDLLTSDSWLLTPASWCLHELFAAQAARTPDAIAVVYQVSNGDPTKDEGRMTKDESEPSSFVLRRSSVVQLTYSELDRRANRLAQHLRALGVGPEVRVGLYMERGPELLIGLLGILKAGGAYLPLDPAYPSERLAFMIEDAQAALVLTQAELADDLPQVWALVVAIDAEWPAIAVQPADCPDSCVASANLAYVIYTSGSTGAPKGVLVPHAGLGNLVAAQSAAFTVRPGSRVLQFAAPGFDAAVAEVAVTLLAGATLVLVPRDDLLPGPELIRLLHEQAITIVTLPPSALAALPDAPLPALRTIVAAGEACPAASVARWSAGRRFVNAYGPTEATVCATLSTSPGHKSVPTIGRPIAGARIYLLDRHLRPAPIGVAGELHIGGVGLARGYLNGPNLTAERFIPNPFARVSGVGYRVSEDTAPNTRHPIPDTRLYKTGDLARYRADGSIEFLGRADGQIKLRGYRVELGEIEATLARHPALRAAAVLAREDAPGDMRLVAYIVPSDDGQWTIDDGSDSVPSSIVYRLSSLTAELRDFLKARLPDYMLPAAFVTLGALPTTPNGKLDRAALPSPEAVHPAQDDTFVAPRTPVEALLARLWTDLLRVERVGAEDNFFALGGHSLLATQLIARVREAFQVELPVQRLFAAPALAAQAEQIEAEQRARRGLSMPRLAPVPREGDLPLSFAQQRLWFLDRLAPGNPFYNLPAAVGMSGPLDLAAFRRSIHGLVRRHETLRTTFATVDGQPIQRIAAPDEDALSAPLQPLVDLGGLPEARREGAARELARVQARRPFDLARGRLLRVTLARLGPREHVLLVTLHHIISDGWSMAVLVHEIATLYAAGAVGQAAALPNLPIQYADYTVWQRRWLEGEDGAGHPTPLQIQLAFWKNHLMGSHAGPQPGRHAGPPLLELPTDRPRPPVQSYRGAVYSFGVDQALTEALGALSGRAGATLFMTLLAAFDLLMQRYSGQSEIVVGTPIAGRTQPETEGLIGCFVNTLALRSDLSGDPPFRELLERVRALCLDAYAHQDLPFERLVEELQPARNLNRHPLFQVEFALQNMPLPALTASDLELHPLAIPGETARFDMVLGVTEHAASLWASWEYSTDLFDAATIRRMSAHWRTLLAGIVADPDRRLADLPLLSTAERAQLLAEWNDTTTGVRSQESGVSRGEACLVPTWLAGSGSKFLHELFAAQAAQTPDAVAVVFDKTKDEGRRTKDESELSSFVVRHSSIAHLTYRELDTRANQLAQHLRTLGVGPEVRVGLCMERAPELLIGLLGIFKADGAYVPLDPAYPIERLAFMLEDAQLAVLLTQERLLDQLPSHGALVISIDADWPLIALSPAAAPSVAVWPDNLAYVIYTSGSTGRPKGVLVAHHGLQNLLAAQRAVFDLPADSRIAQFASLSFDAALYEVITAIESGGLLYLAPPEAVLPGSGLPRLLREQAITSITIPPSALAVTPSADLPALHTILVAGEACPPAVVARWSARRRFFNCYGPTEATVWASFERCAADGRSPTIGRPIPNARIYLLDRRMQPAPIGVPGELYIGGTGLARGYLNRPDLTAERFVPNPFAEVSGTGYRVLEDAAPNTRYPTPDTRLYKTGDMARYRHDGTIEYLGRIDQQVKLRGFRIELGEIAATLAQHPAIGAATVVVREDRSGDPNVVAYVVPAEGTGDREQGTAIGSRQSAVGSWMTNDERRTTNDESEPSSFVTELRDFLKARLPDYMIPAAFVALDILPLTPNGKVDHRALPSPLEARAAPAADQAPQTALEGMIGAIWQEVLQIGAIGREENFFDLGGHSLRMVEVQHKLQATLGRELAIVDLFRYPTISALAQFLGGDERPAEGALRHSHARAAQRRSILGAPAPTTHDHPEPASRTNGVGPAHHHPEPAWRTNGVAPPRPAAAPEIAIIGMNGRFPGALTIEDFWRNLRDGVEAISFFTDEELLAAGISPALLRDPRYVKARGVLDEIELFDAAFFGYSPREAEIMDPQQRLFLECAHEALERAGYVPHGGAVGVYAGIGMNHYWLNLVAAPDVLETLGSYQAAIANDRDFFATRVSYKLNLRGPSLTVQTACSTSLVAVHLACQSLLHGECDLALAGGISLAVPARNGYLYVEGGISSPDGHCRAFDADARGCVGGSGVGVVVLKRLAEALADGDTILAVIKGSAINNDGADKVGYTAPSVAGQAAVIAEALAVAGVPPETIGYVEAHGTGTPLGDPIELAALTRAFRAHTGATSFCALGAVKSSVGHLDAAAGVTGLIKAVLALQHGQIPPMPHFRAPNPQIDIAASPFYVPTRLADWPANGHPRRAGVSAFGLGGTNAHVVLEQAPASAPAASARPHQLLLLSARTAAALDAATGQLAQHLAAQPDQPLADIAYTLQVGRVAFAHRCALVCADPHEAQAALAGRDPARLLGGQHDGPPRPVAFMFPGQGAQHPGMARGLYTHEPVFRAVVDRCAELLRPHLGIDIRAVLYPTSDERRTTNDESEPSSFVLRPSSDPGTRLEQTWVAQPALFVVEYALARLWMSWGIKPAAMIGHSIGEYVAACLAGVFSLEDALELVAARGWLMQLLPEGAMLSVRLPAAELRALLPPDLALAAINGPALCVVSGAPAAIAAFRDRLEALGAEHRLLRTSHAFHSAMMDPIVEPFTELVARIGLRPPTIPYISNVSGTWITAAQATDPAYWAAHLRQTVRFADGLAALLDNPARLLLEVGPEQALSILARQQTGMERIVVASLPRAAERQPETAALLAAAGKIWLAGAALDWAGLHAGARPRRVCLPTYPFERRRYWIDARPQPRQPAPLAKKDEIADWFYLPIWKRMPLLNPAAPTERRTWLVFADESGLGARLCARLAAAGQEAVAVRMGPEFQRLDEYAYTLDPGRRADYTALLRDLALRARLPGAILHLWSVLPGDARPMPGAPLDGSVERGMFSLIRLAQALEQLRVTSPLQLVAITSHLHSVRGDETIAPQQAAILGPCKVIPQEYPNILCRSVDVALPDRDGQAMDQLADQLLAECDAPPDASVVAYRGPHRWVQAVEAVRLEDASAGRARLRTRGVYMITGGLGRVGLALAEGLARAARARLVLVGRTALPQRAAWDDWLAQRPDDDRLSRAIRDVRALEAHGAEVLTLSADVADEPQMRAAIAQAEARFGPIQGVIHAAGLSGPAAVRTIAETEPSVAEQHFRPKMGGMLVLDALLRDHALDFRILQSSLAAVAGGLGFCAYAAANCVLDALAQQRQYQPRPADDALWTSVNWDGWRFDDAPAGALAARGAHAAMLPGEGVAAFERLLALGTLPQILISTTDLPQRLAHWRAPRLEQAEVGSAQHPRPQVATSYVAPGSPLEATIVESWQAALGIAPIGIYDNFFELGGHSLLATQVVSRIREAAQVEVPLHELFETPTVAGLARAIVARLTKPQAAPVTRIEAVLRENPEALLATLDDLSEAEVDALLGTMAAEEETQL